MSTETIDTLYTNITLHRKNISIFSIYNSQKNNYHHFKNHINQILHKKIEKDQNIIIIGDFNIEYNTKNYFKLCSQMSKYNLKQHITKYTIINNTTIDLLFTNLEIEQINYFYSHWSDHNILQCQITL